MSEKKIVMTNQRMMIIDFLKQNYTHPNVDNIYEHIKKKLPRISKKTVYRNLQFLTQKNIVQEIKTSGPQRYEIAKNKHFHAICSKCNEVTDIESNELSNNLKKFAKKIKNFEIKFSQLNYYGLCKKCLGGK